MPGHNRATLYNYFADGEMPSGERFRDLVDSMLNMEDEGFRKTPRNGFEVTALDRYDALLSFFRQGREAPLWAMSLTDERNRLAFRHIDGATNVLTLDVKPDAVPGPGLVGINTERPEHALDVAGTVRTHGRIGGLPLPGRAPPLADGEWHDITEPLRGCQAFEVMAGVGREHSGRFAMMHATAMNAFNPAAGPLGLFHRFLDRKRIREQHAWYGKRCDRLQLRWWGSSGRNAEYRLQIRTRCVYESDVPNEPDVPIQVQLTKLWFDPFMQGTAP